MKKVFLTSLVSTCIFLSGCSAISKLDYETGVNVTQSQMQSFKPGETHKDDVVALIGEPGKKEMLGEVEIWRYHHVLIPALPTKKNINEDTVFEWDNNSKLLKAYKTASTSSII